MLPRSLDHSGGIFFARFRWLASPLRIDFAVERNPEAFVLDPGDASANLADVAQLDFKPVSTLNHQGAFGHHTAIRQVPHAHTMRIRCVLNSHIREQEKAVTRYATCFNT